MIAKDHNSPYFAIPIITANAIIVANDLGVAASGDAAIEGVLKNDAPIVVVPWGWGRLVDAAMASNYYVWAEGSVFS